RGAARRDLHHAGLHRRRRGCWYNRTLDFAVERQLMQHIGQGFGMHQAVFDGHLEEEAILQERLGRVVERSELQTCVERLPQPVLVRLDLRPPWPVRWLVSGYFAAYRINPKGKQPIELLVKRVQPKHIAAQQVPIERFQMSEVEDDEGPFRHRSVIERLEAHDGERL